MMTGSVTGKTLSGLSTCSPDSPISGQDDYHLLNILNLGFFVFHTLWIAFNCVGWVWRRTRRWQFLTLTLTTLSWFGLGIWYGWGYCPCTDWHWQVRARLGYDDPPSYVQLLVRGEAVSAPEESAARTCCRTCS
jgi:hypothetical protein